MNNNILIVGIIVIAVLIIGWWIVRISPNPLPSTDIPSTIQTQTQTQVPQQREASAPIVITSQAAVPSDTAVVLTGNVTPNGAFTNYWYEYGTTANLGSKTTNQMIGSGFMTIPAPMYISGLTKDTTYYFRLNAQNQFGSVAGTQYAFQTTLGLPAPIGGAPQATTLPESKLSKTAATLNGEVMPNKSTTQYWFEYGGTVNLGNTTAFVSIGDGSATVPVSVRLSDLNPATTYYFRLNAQNRFGTINGGIVNFKTVGPATTTE